MIAYRPNSLHARHRGVALLLVLFAVAIAVVLAVTFLVNQSTTLGISQNLDNQTNARAIAEAGLNLTLKYMRDNQAWRSERSVGQWVNDQAYGSGTYSIWAADPDSNLLNDPTQPVTLTARGTYKGVTHTINTVVTPTIPIVRRLLMVVPNTGSLSAQDTNKKALFEGWGYTVTLINHGDSQGIFNTAITGNDVVFISNSCTASTVGAKLTAFPIGVVSELSGTHANLLFATSAGVEYTQDRITITDNTHYITQPFATGTLVVASSTTSLVRLSGTLATGAQGLANIFGGSTRALQATEANAAQSDGTPSSGRRVALPWGGTTFDINKLNTDGRNILKRSLDWAAQPMVPRTPIAHWTMGETNGNICYDSVGTNHGTYMNGVWLGQLGPMGNAASFDGVNDYVMVPNAAVLNLRPAITITAWIYPNNWASGNRRIMQKGNADNQYRLLSESGSFKFDLNGVASMSTTFPPTGQWIHVAATYDGVRMRVFFNGQLAAQQNASGLINTTSDPLQIGTKKVGAPPIDSFDGIMDDVRIYDYGLNAAEVNYLYSQGSVNSATPQPQLVALYTFQQQINQPVLLHNWTLNESGGGGGAAANDNFTIQNLSVVVAYDSSRGPYGTGNVLANAVVSTNSTSSGKLTIADYGNVNGDAYCGAGGTPGSVISSTANGVSGSKAAMASNVTMPAVSAPGGMPASLNNQTIAADTTINANRHYNDLAITGTAVVTISGNVIILCDGNFSMSGTAQVVIPSGSSLTLYVSKGITMSNSAQLNGDSAAVSRLTLYQISSSSSDTTTVQDGTVLSGIVHCRQSISINGTSHLYGRLLCNDDITVSGSAMLVVDVAQVSLGPAKPPASDAAGSFTGTYINGVTLAAAGDGDGGTSAGFDGTNDYIVVNNSNTMLLSEGAISFWFRPTAVTGTKGLISKDATGFATGGHFLISTNGTAVVAKLDSATVSTSITGGTIAANNWYHAVFTFGPAGMRLYLNGSQVASNASCIGGTGTTSGGAGNREPMIIGADSSGSTTLTGLPLANYFSGRIDDVRVYNAQISATQVSNLYNRQPLSASVAPSMVVYDTSGAPGGPINLYISDTTKATWVNGGGININAATKIFSPVAYSKLATQLQANGQMTLHVIFTPGNISQNGPAQIVGYSSTTSLRNFVLGQSNATYDFRLRTAATGTGATPAFTSGNVLSATTTQNIILTYDQTNVRIYRNSVLEQTTARIGGFANWDTTMRLVLGNEDSNAAPWVGLLQRVAVYDRAFNTFQVNNVFAGQPPGDGTGVQKLSSMWNESP